MLSRFVCSLSVVTLLSACLLPSARAAELDQAALSGDKAPKGTIWLESLDLSKIEQGWGEPHAGRSVGNNPLTIHGQKFRHGVGTHAVSEMHIDLHGAAEQFVSMVGVDDEAKTGTVSFEVWVDGKKAAESGRMKGGDAAKRVQADLHGAKRLSLVVGDAEDGIECDHADWAGAVLVLAPGATQRPQTTTMTVEAGPLPAIVHEESPAAGHPRPADRRQHAGPARSCSSFRPRAKSRCTLPPRTCRRASRSIAETGIITGSLKEAGTTVVELEVKNARGDAQRKLTIVGGQHKLALTPPMGWNSWNCWAGAVSDAKVRAAADAMVKSGLAAHGFQYVNIDDCWEGKRDANGEIQTNEKFPDMKALADYVHGKGLKLGIYSSPGPKTCAGFEASWKHEAQDAATYAKWGIDYLKYDWCSYGDIDRNPDLAGFKKPYHVMREGAGRVQPRHRLQPLPVRHGRRLEMGRRGRRQLLADHRRHHRQLGQPVGHRLQPGRPREVCRPRPLERSGHAGRRARSAGGPRCIPRI